MEHDILTARGRLALDAGLFVAIFVASRPTWTGIGLHEWLAALLIVPALYHLIINWDWVMRAIPRLIEKLKSTSRVNIGIDAVLFLSMITVSVSGLMLVPGVLPPFTNAEVTSVWRTAHQIGSDVTIVAMIAHFAMHVRWIADAAAKWDDTSTNLPDPLEEVER